MSTPNELPASPEQQVLQHLKITLALFRRNAQDIALAKACLVEEERVMKRLDRLESQTMQEEAA